MSIEPSGSSPSGPQQRAGGRSIVRAAVTGSQRASARDSERVAEVRARAQERLHRQRGTLRPLGWAVLFVVVLGSANSHPVPGLHGQALAVTVALCAFAVTLLIAVRDGFPERSVELQTVVIAVMGAAGVAIAGLQPKGASEVAAGVAVFMAITRLPFNAGVAIAGAVTVALGAVTAAAGSSSSAVAAGALVMVLVGVVAQFLKQSRESQDRTEILLAQLEDARDDQARAAAIAERGRIASELHDVLAHSLSGAAIQLQGARKLAEREHAQPPLSDAIDRASELVKAGLANARQAVGTLRGDALPTLAQLPALIDSYKTDMNLDVTLRIEGEPADATGRSEPRALSRRTGSADERRALRAQRVHHGHRALRTRRHQAVGRERRLGHPTATRNGRRPRTPRAARADRAGRRHDVGRRDTRGLAGRDRGARMTIRVLIADDQPVVRDGLAMLLGLIDDVEIVATAADGIEAVERARAERPDIVLMDLRMPRLEGAEATRQILASLPDTRVLVLTTYADDEFLFPALQAGARGYLTKDATAEEIEHAIRALIAGHTHLDPAVQQRLVTAVLDQTPPAPAGEPAPASPPNLPDELTPREVEVLKLIAAGLSNTEIADQLVLSHATVKTHINRIFYKTGARDRAQAVRYAYQHRLT